MSKGISLAQLQNELESAAENHQAAIKAKIEADRAYDLSVTRLEKSREALNAGVAALKSQNTLTNLYAG